MSLSEELASCENTSSEEPDVEGANLGNRPSRGTEEGGRRIRRT